MKKYIFILAALGFVIHTQAQSIISSYNFERVGEFHIANPAAYQPYRAVVGLPVLGGLSLGVRNAFSPGALTGVETTANEDIEALLTDLNKGDRLTADVGLDLIYVSFRSGRSHWSMGSRLRTTVNFEYPIELLNLAYYGSEHSSVGGKLNIDGNKTSANAYLSYHVGYQREMMEGKWRIGGRLSYLSGLAHASAKKMRIDGTFNANEWVIDSDIEVNTSMADTSFDNISSILFSGNRGFAVDLGVSYEIIPNLELSFSMLDLGGIQWASHTTKYKSAGDYTWTGAKWNYGDSTEFDEEAILDTLMERFNIQETEGESFWANLPRSFVLGARYDITPKHGFGATYQLNQWGDRLYHNVGVSYIGNWSKWFSAYVDYSIIQGDYVNLGVGFSANLGPIQLYLLTDDVLVAKLDKDNMNMVNIRFGMNVALFRKDLKGYEAKVEPPVEMEKVDIEQPENEKPQE